MNKIMYKSMDPLEIENRFSDEKNFFFEQEDNNLRYEDFEPFLDKLPSKERDLIRLYYYQDKKQKEIAEIFSVTQGAISHRLSRAGKRLRFLRDMPKLEVDIDLVLKPYFEPFEIDLINTMISTTCQSKTAEILNEKYNLIGDEKMTQVKIRHKFERFIERLKKNKRKDENIAICFKLLKYIQKNLYMMHEVVLPHFDKGSRVRFNHIC
ncbi:MAG TPA: sigma-70 family RNA polymerase sigma factor [Exilispira sp.]|nr:sigma-70 family RNA polymerase sigma factor [Exilispira sp.]